MVRTGGRVGCWATVAARSPNPVIRPQQLPIIIIKTQSECGYQYVQVFRTATDARLLRLACVIME